LPIIPGVEDDHADGARHSRDDVLVLDRFTAVVGVLEGVHEIAAVVVIANAQIDRPLLGQRGQHRLDVLVRLGAAMPTG